MYVDFRTLNYITVKSRCPLQVEDMSDQISNTKAFSKLDLTFGYWHEAIAKTAFSTKYGHFELMVMSFDLCSALATFLHLISLKTFFTLHGVPEAIVR